MSGRFTEILRLPMYVFKDSEAKIDMELLDIIYF